MNEKKELKRIQLTGLWEKEVNGARVMTGNLGGAQVEIWPNGHKKESNHPDYILYIAPQYKKKEKSAGESLGFSDDIPF